MAKERFSARLHRRLFRPVATLQHNRSRLPHDFRRMLRQPHTAAKTQIEVCQQLCLLPGQYLRALCKLKVHLHENTGHRGRRFRSDIGVFVFLQLEGEVDARHRKHCAVPQLALPAAVRFASRLFRVKTLHQVDPLDHIPNIRAEAGDGGLATRDEDVFEDSPQTCTRPSAPRRGQSP